MLKKKTAATPSPPSVKFGITESAGNVPGPPWAVGPGGSKVFVLVIRELSPNKTQTNIAEATYDDPKTMQTIGHEAGHSVGMEDVQNSPAGSCNPNPPPTTVMFTNYWTNTNPKNSPSCQWNHIPHQYTPADLEQLRTT